MDVFLVPGGEGRYELYCEPREVEQTERGGLAGRLLRRLRELMASEQAERESGARPAEAQTGWVARAKASLIRGLAEWVAEQRLLWHLRHQQTASLIHPADLPSNRAWSIASGMLQRDQDHHRVWMVVDGLAVLVFGPLFFFVPGPNLISWYFAGKMGGHWLAFRGARRGLTAVEWSVKSSEPLREVRQVLSLPPAERQGRLRVIADQLQLEHLSRFVERTLPESC